MGSSPSKPAAAPVARQRQLVAGSVLLGMPDLGPETNEKKGKKWTDAASATGMLYNVFHKDDKVLAWQVIANKPPLPPNAQPTH